MCYLSVDPYSFKVLYIDLSVWLRLFLLVNILPGHFAEHLNFLQLALKLKHPRTMELSAWYPLPNMQLILGDIRELRIFILFNTVLINIILL